MGKSGRYTLYFGPSYYTRVYPISRRAQCVKSNSPRSFLILPHFPFPDPAPPMFSTSKICIVLSTSLLDVRVIRCINISNDVANVDIAQWRRQCYRGNDWQC